MTTSNIVARIVHVQTPDPYGFASVTDAREELQNDYFLLPNGVCFTTEGDVGKLHSAYYIIDGPSKNDDAIKFFVADVLRYNSKAKIKTIEPKQFLELLSSWKRQLVADADSAEEQQFINDATKLIQSWSTHVASVDDLMDAIKNLHLSQEESLSDDSIRIMTDDLARHWSRSYSDHSYCSDCSQCSRCSHSSHCSRSPRRRHSRSYSRSDSSSRSYEKGRYSPQLNVKKSRSKSKEKKHSRDRSDDKEKKHSKDRSEDKEKKHSEDRSDDKGKKKHSRDRSEDKRKRQKIF